MSQHIQVQQLLVQLQTAMQQDQLWLSEPPAADAFNSTEPFCIDTMSFVQWLQFVFIARMQALLDAQANLPTNASITPLAEEYFRINGIQAPQVMAALAQLEQCLSQG